MDRLQNFDSFSAARKQEVKVKLQQEQEAKRSSSAETFKSLLAEYGVTDLKELDEEQRTSFFNRLKGNEVNEDVSYLINKLQEAYSINEAAGNSADMKQLVDILSNYKAMSKMIHKDFMKAAKEIKSFSKDYDYELEDVFNKYQRLDLNQKQKWTSKDWLNWLDNWPLAESFQVYEAEVSSDAEFKEYAFSVLKKAFGDDFDETKAQETVDGILGKADGDYGAAIGMLTSGLGESVEFNEGRFYAFHKGQKHEVEADSLWKAKQKAITDLNVKKKDVGLLAVVNADQHDDFSSGKNADFAFENEVNEADIKSADEFKEYAFDTLKKAFGDDFDEAKAQEVVDGILDKCGDDYGACVGMLNKSLGS
jgi:hypothetical protein